VIKKDVIVHILIGFLVIITLPLIIIVILVSIPLSLYSSKKSDKEYHDFLLQNNGKNFFVYNERKNSLEFTEKEILPHLNSNINIIYLAGGKTGEAEKYPREFFTRVLHSTESYSKFPHLMKIRNEELVDKSVNISFFSVKHQIKNINKFLLEIDNFFNV
jgi:hypothetical protein